jgi:hypothetical protein
LNDRQCDDVVSLTREDNGIYTALPLYVQIHILLMQKVRDPFSLNRTLPFAPVAGCGESVLQVRGDVFQRRFERLDAAKVCDAGARTLAGRFSFSLSVSMLRSFE